MLRNTSFINNDTISDYEHKRQYYQLADYLDTFRDYSAEKTMSLRNYSDELRRKAERYEHLFSTIRDPKRRAAVDFYDRIFENGGFNYIPNMKDANGNDTDQENIYRKQYNDIWNNYLGDSIGIRFHAKKQSFLGLDLLVPDNTDYDFDSFLQRSGLSADDFNDENKIKMRRNEDGSVDLKVDRNSPLASTILYNAGSNDNYLNFYRPIIETYHKDKNGEEHKDFFNPIKDFVLDKIDRLGLNDADISPLTGSGIGVVRGLMSSGYSDFSKGAALRTKGQIGVDSLINLINDAKEERDAAYNDAILDENAANAIIIYGNMPFEDELMSMLANDQIKSEQYNALRKYNYDIINGLLAGDGSQYSMYTNLSNHSNNFENIDDDSVTREQILKALHWAITASGNGDNPKSYLKLQAADMKDTLGTYFTLTVTDANSKNGNDDVTALAKYCGLNVDELKKGFSVFIPGFMTEDVQAARDRDPRNKATTILNDIDTYGYNHRLNSIKGSSITKEYNNGSYSYVIKNANGSVRNIYTKEEALNFIAQDEFIKDLTRGLYFKHTSATDPHIINVEAYRRDLELAATKFVNELYGIDSGVFTPNDYTDLLDSDNQNTETAKKMTAYSHIVDSVNAYMTLEEALR